MPDYNMCTLGITLYGRYLDYSVKNFVFHWYIERTYIGGVAFEVIKN